MKRTHPPHRSPARPLGRGDLRLLLLALIEQQPRHGYELIQLIGQLFKGAYAPSPGVVYPTLALLEDMGLIAAEHDGGRKRYAITADGQKQADAERDTIQAAQARAHASARRIAKAALPPPVREAMERLKQALMLRSGHWQQADTERITALLDEAAALARPHLQERTLVRDDAFPVKSPRR